MSTTQETLNNYFQSAKKFMDSWVDYLKSIAPDGEKNPEMEKAFSEYTKWMGDFANKAENYIKAEVDKIANMTPEDMQKKSLDNINKFEAAYKKTTDAIYEGIEKEKAYIASDKFLTDVQEGRQKASSVYNATLNSVSKMFDSFADVFKNMKS